MRKTSLIGLFVFCLVLALPAVAGEVSGSGSAIVVSDAPSETELADGRIYEERHLNQVLRSDGHPFDGVVMSCGGVCLMDGEDGTCFGGCTGMDRDGDMIHFSYDGNTSGGWNLLGGTGKWVGSSGSGTWENIGPAGAGFSKTDWTGTIQIK